jgi:hypothetical protein
VNSVNVKNVKNGSNTHNMCLWHKRLGHLHVNGMNMLMNKQMVIDYPILSHSTANTNTVVVIIFLVYNTNSVFALNIVI